MEKNNVEDVKGAKVLEAEDIKDINDEGDNIDEETQKDLEKAMKIVACTNKAKKVGNTVWNITKKAALIGIGVCVGGLLFKNKGSTVNDNDVANTDTEDITVDEEDTTEEVNDSTEENA